MASNSYDIVSPLNKWPCAKLSFVNAVSLINKYISSIFCIKSWFFF